MSDAWKDYPGAPAPGAVIGPLTIAVEGQATCVEVGAFPLVLLRKAGSVRAFVNACPHQYLPLNYKGDRLLSSDGTVLRCTNHSAGFDASTGEGVEGLGLGACLDPVPVAVTADQMIVIG